MLNIKNSNTEIIDAVSDYWNVRSESYSKQNIAELHCSKRDIWKELILENAPTKKKLKILDVGTGPGFFAINLALDGHEVTAVDCTEAMLRKASKNAINYGVDIEFKYANAHELPFDDNTFDLIISRNVVWNLESPNKALKEWYRVLKDNGRLIYFDANWYLYLFDEELSKKIEISRRRAEKLFPEECDPAKYIGFKMEEIAYDLPLSRKVRPEWDKEALCGCGYKIISIDGNIGNLVWSEREKILYEETPMFRVCAEK